MKPLVTNRKAKYDYFLSDRYEAGISLLGHEVKSIREGRANLKESFVRCVGGELFLFNCHITPYSKLQGHVELDPTRSRKLLLKKFEINKIMGAMTRKGYACIPTCFYIKKGYIKVEIAIGQGKKAVDKRETIKKRIHDREAKAAMKKYSR